MPRRSFHRHATTLTRRMIARAALPPPIAAMLVALSLGAIALLTS